MAGAYGVIKVQHNFAASLRASHEAEDMPLWREVYQKAFPTMQEMINHRQDGDHQRQGIDRSIILRNSKQILVDEKVRFKPYDDILLEVWSDFERKKPGWVAKDLLCDYIAYAVEPLGKCYLLPVPQLRLAWKKGWQRSAQGNQGKKMPRCLAGRSGAGLTKHGDYMSTDKTVQAPNYSKYEAEKKRIAMLNLTPEQYQKEIKKIANGCGV